MRYLPIILIAALFVPGCTEKQDHPFEQTKTVQKNIPLKWTRIMEAQPSFSITLPGELKPYEEVRIYPKIKAFVRRIYVDRGSVVYKGQLLAQLEAPEIAAQLASRNAATSASYHKFLFSKQSYARLREAALKAGAVATIELERAHAQYLGDSAAYRSSLSEASATEDLQNYLRIKAPFTGTITGRFASEGALVGENGKEEALFQLTQENRLRLVVAIPEKQLQALTQEAKASFTLIDNPGKTYKASLSRTSVAVDSHLKSVIAEFDIDNSGNDIRSGQFAKVSVHLKRRQSTMWVPASSVVEAQSGVFVVKNEAGITRRISVQKGVTKDTLVEVFGNLNAGDQILLKGSEEVKEGIKIDK